MQISMELIAIIIGLVVTILSTAIALLVYLSSRRSQRAEIHREIEHAYDKLMDFRASHPEVMAMSREWKSECFKLLYSTIKKDGKPWVLYYTYVELCLGFINAVLYGRDIKVLDRHAYLYHYKPLILLLLTEHYPYIKTVLESNYLSEYIKLFIQEVEMSGWKWQERHQALAA